MSTIRFRRGTAAAWTSINPVLLAGEPAYETDTGKAKIGDGNSLWAVLPYLLGGGGGAVSYASQAEAIAGTLQDKVISPFTLAAAFNAFVGAAPDTLNAINELAAALGDDPDFATTIAASLSQKQPINGNLTALAGLTSAADRLPYFSGGSGAMSLATLTPAARALLDDADAAAMVATLGAVKAPTISGVKLVENFIFTDPAVARPAVEAYVSLNWIGPAGSGSSAPVNMATGDTWDLQS